MLIILGVILILLFLSDLFIGSVHLPFRVVINYLSGGEINEIDQTILHYSRLPKALTAVICGAALSVAGLQMQTLFRNPLAGPYILGISSGAGLGVAILLMGLGFLGLSAISAWSLAAAAFAGAFSILLILLILSYRIKDVMTLLIVGIMIGAVATALIGILQYFSTDFQLKSFVIWSLGSLDSVSYQKLGIMGGACALAILIAFFSSKPLNALLMGEAFASSIGIKINRIRILSILSTGILAGTVTAYCGPIGFVGIVVPHLSRMLFQTTDHSWLIPICALLGGISLLFADILSHLFVNQIALPINSITALLGIPIIIWILLSRKRISRSF
jgi:iron complex transport system permease protein